MLNHKGTIEIETQRLILRRFTRDDSDSMFNNWASDGDISKYMRWQQHENIEDTKSIIKQWLLDYNRASFYIWAITLKESDEPIGSIGLFVINENDLCGDVGYSLGKKYWGQGITTEALRGVLGFAFENIGFNRIETYHSINNPASGKVMQKSGMIFEGFAKQKYKSIFGFEDCNMYSILKEDYKKQ
jgi:[ribosomal protein S5]-alanine N-acetyltransferase